MKRRSFLLMALCAVSLLAACGAEGLAVGNLLRHEGGVSFKLANDSSTTGDVVIWIEQGGATSCERLLRVEAHNAYDVKMRCLLSPESYMVRFAWASAARERALVAERIE